MKINCVLLAILAVLNGAWCADLLKLSAYEYRRHVNQTLSPGQCANRIKQYQDKAILEHCNYPNRSGTPYVRTKPSFYPYKSTLNNITDLFKVMPLCNQEAADYFGFLAKGECVSTEIAQKLSFSKKTAVLVQLEHERLKINELRASNNVENTPKEFTLYLKDSYYTQKIDIGTDELIIVEMRFKKAADASMVKSNYDNQKLSDYLKRIVNSRSVAQPKRFKVIRFSTADNLFETKVFKGSGDRYRALHYVEHSEEHIKHIKHVLKRGDIEPHLRYTFKAYEIGPIALPLQTISEDEKRRLWEEIAVMQVEYKRTYSSNKKYRKICRLTKDYRKDINNFCHLARQTLRRLKKTVTEVIKMRRTWSNISYENQELTIRKLKMKLKIFADKMKEVAKEFKKLTKKKP